MGLEKPSLQVGKQFASGTVNLPATGTVSVTGIPFTPTKIMLFKQSSGYDEISGIYDITTATSFIFQWNTAHNLFARSWSSFSNIVNGGFSIVMSNGNIANNVNWVAFE